MHQQSHYRSWEFVWEYMLQEAAVRSWLFRTDNPTFEETIQLIQNAPYLSNCEQTLVRRQGVSLNNKESYLPNVSDLNTVYKCIDNETILGYTFRLLNAYFDFRHGGYQKSNSPTTYEIVRTVWKRFYSHDENQDYLLKLDTKWTKEGTLFVMACSVPITTQNEASQDFYFTSGYYFERLHFRFFSAEQAQKLLSMSNKLNDIVMGNDDFCDMSTYEDCDFSSFFHPTFVHGGCWEYLHDCEKGKKEHDSCKQEQELESTSSTIKQHKLSLWSKIVSALLKTKPTVIISSSFFHKKSMELDSKSETHVLMDNIVSTQLNIQGRIQKICTQLNIIDSSGLIDTYYFSKNRSCGCSSIYNMIDMMNDSSKYSKCYACVERFVKFFFNAIAKSNVIRKGGFKPSSITLQDNQQVKSNLSTTTFNRSNAEKITMQPNSLNLFASNQMEVSSQAIGIDFMKDVTKEKILVDNVKLYNHEDIPLNSLGYEDQKQQIEQPKVKSDSITIYLKDSPTTLIDSNFGKDKSKILNISTDYKDISSNNYKDRGKARSKRTWECDKCHRKFIGKKASLRRHIEIVHNKRYSYHCTEEKCTRKFQTQSNLKRHILAVHKHKKYACQHCSRKFNNQAWLEEHLSSAHSNFQESFQCEHCKGCYSSMFSLRRHMVDCQSKVEDTKVIVNS